MVNRDALYLVLCTLCFVLSGSNKAQSTKDKVPGTEIKISRFPINESCRLN